MVGLTFDGQEKTLAEHWPILTSDLADVLELLQSGCVLDRCAGRGFVKCVEASSSASRQAISSRAAPPAFNSAARASLAATASDPPAR
jgi:hypothetical protein